MKNMTLEKIAEAVGGKLFGTGEAVKKEVTGVVLDSRQVEEGYLFIATKGEKVDGHTFIDSVYEKGALGVVSEQELANPKGPYILVEDSFQALKDMAEFYRKQLSVRVIGITGSVGKTSTKECIAAALSSKYHVLKTSGNFNNEVGLPLTVLRIREEHEVAVLEMGISDFGEMHRLSKIARPDICVITNIGQCHLENLKTRDGILKAKSEIFDFMSGNGAICVNGDDDKLATLTEVKGIKPVFFGRNSSVQVFATDVVNKGLAGSSLVAHRKINDIEDSFTVEIPLPGEHMVYNALAAISVGTMLGLTSEELVKGIASVEPVGGRSHIINTDKFIVIDDCYNANPVSMKAAIDLLSMANTRKVAVLGDMFELGVKEKALHEEVGIYAAEQKIDCIICTGELSECMYKGAKEHSTVSEVIYCKDREVLLMELESCLKDGDTVLVKASHGMHFEEVVKRLS